MSFWNVSFLMRLERRHFSLCFVGVVNECV